MKSDQPGKPEGLDSEFEFAAVWQCNTGARGASISFINGRVYTSSPVASGKKCSLAWHVDFGILPTYLDAAETVAKWNCDENSASHVDLELITRPNTESDKGRDKVSKLSDGFFGNSFAACEAVIEHSPSGTKIGEPLLAIDPDNAQNVTFSIVSAPFNAMQIFSIDRNTGQISVKNGNAPSLLDFESKTTPRSIILTIAATDSHVPSKRTMFDILVSIQDSNEPPAMPPTAIFNVREDAAPGTKLSFSSDDRKRNAQSIAAARGKTRNTEKTNQDLQTHIVLKSTKIRSVRALSWSSQTSSHHTAMSAVDGTKETYWLVPKETFGQEHWLWVDLRKRHHIDKIRMKIFRGNGNINSGTVRARVHIAPGNVALERRENWWGALDKTNSWIMATKNHAVTSIWRNHNECKSILCIEEATSALGVDHENCVEIPWKTNGESSSCPKGYYISGFRTKGVSNTGAFDQMRCCADLYEKQTLKLDWKSCFEADWSESFSEKGWSGCSDPKQSQGLDSIFKLAGLTSECSDNINCIKKASCCRSPHAAADPISVRGATSLDINLKDSEDAWNSFNNIVGMTSVRHIRVSVSLDNEAIALNKGQQQWIKMPEIEFYGAESSTLQGFSADSPWEPSILWETGKFADKRRPRSSSEIIDAVDKSDFNARGYCSGFVQSVSLKSNRQCPSGSNRNIASRATIRFSLRQTSKISFRFGADFGIGSAIVLDGNVVSSHAESLWWGGRWTHPHADILSVSNTRLERGNHELLVYGLENCCDGSHTYQFKIDDDRDSEYSGKWQDISVENLSSYTGSTLSGKDSDTGANGRLSYRLGSKTVAPYVCAEREGATCKGCTGTVFYGKKFLRGRPGSGKTTTLSQLKLEDHATRISRGADISCSNGAFGDPLRGIYKYCYCVAEADTGETSERLPFSIDDISGQVILSENVNALDFESAQQHTFSITAIDGGGMEASTQVTVNVIDINEPPSFSASKVTFNIREGSAVGTRIGQVTATDPDAGQTLSYRILNSGSDVGQAMSIIECDGTIVLGDNIDYEIRDTYLFEVKVIDDGAPTPRSASIIVTVNIVDANEPPTCSDTTFSVQENSPKGTRLQGVINATDPDIYDVGMLSYSVEDSLYRSVLSRSDELSILLTGTMIDLPFKVTGTGQLVVSGDLDFEGIAEEYKLTATVTDQAGLFSTCDVTVLIKDVNEPPMYEDGTLFSVVENSPEGTPLTGDSISATDPDASDFGLLKYSIVSNILATRPLPDLVTYTVTVRTATEAGAGTTDDVLFRLFGTSQPSGTPWLALSSSVDESDAVFFRPGSLRVFTVANVPYIGALTAIQFKTAGNDAWVVSQVAIGRPGYNSVQIDEFPSANGNEFASKALIQGAASSPLLPVRPCLNMANGEPRTTDNSIYGSWACPKGYRLPRADEWNRVKICAQGNVVAGSIDVVTAVGGCNCNNAGSSQRIFCDLPSMETINLGRQCGDNPQLHVCVRSEPLSTALVTSANRFSIDESTGAIYVADDTLDYEDIKAFALGNGEQERGQGRRTLTEDDRSFTIRIRVEDTVGSIAESDVKIQVIDENEAPIIKPQDSKKYVEVPENWSVESGLDKIKVNDVDEADDISSLTVRVAGGDPRGLFQVDSQGFIFIDPAARLAIGGLDYEDASPNDLVLNLEVRDAGGASSNQLYYVRVTDVNEPPFFPMSTYDRIVLENSPEGTLVGAVLHASDQDEDDQAIGALTYSMTELTAGANTLFQMNSTTGQISVTSTGASKLNFEDDAGQTYTFRVVAKDSKGLDSESGVTGHATNVTISVADVNEAPVFPDNDFKAAISSESSTGQHVGPPIVAIDEDEGDELAYVIVRDNQIVQTGTSVRARSAQCFDIGRSSGQIRYRDQSGLQASDCLRGDRVHELNIICFDSGNLQTSKKAIITIVQANRNPVISPPREPSFVVTENGNGNTIVGTISASDEDDDELLFSLQDKSSMFTIDKRTGALSVLKPLDYESKSLYSLVVTATEDVDGRTYQLTDTRTFSVQVIDVNEPPVVIDVANRTVPENSQIGYLVGQPVSVIDPDAGTILAFSMRANEHFSLIPDQGQIYVSGSLDFEVRDFHTVHVTAEDAGGLTSEQAVIIVQVSDVNEPPSIAAKSSRPGTSTITNMNPTAYVMENAAAGTALATVTGFDNETSRDFLSFFLLEDGERQGSDLFRVVKTSEGFAEVQLSSNTLDYEAQQTYSLHVCVADDGRANEGLNTKPLSTCAQIMVVVQDVPDMTIEYFGGNVLHETTGGERVHIYGSNFGLRSPDANNSGLVVTYSNGVDAAAASSIVFVAKDCYVEPDGNTKITCLTVPGAGDKLRWTVQIGGTSVTSAHTVTTSYKRPNITSVDLVPQLIPTEGRTSVTLTGSNFGPKTFGSLIRKVHLSVTYGGDSGSVYSAVACRMIEEHAVVTCSTSEGVGVGHNWAMTVEGLRSSIIRVGSAYKAPFVDRIEGAVNMSTTGGEAVYLIGTNFGPVTTPTALSSRLTSLVTVEYGFFEGSNTTVRYVAADCSVRIAHYQIACTTVPGVGQGLEWRVTVGGQTGFPSTVTTSYRRPVITSVTGPGTQGGSTAGGQEVIISGFGFIAGVSINVIYGNKLNSDHKLLESARVYSAKDCVVVVEHFSLRCYTSEGTGSGHAWQVSVEGLGNSSLFLGDTNYAPPVIAEIKGAGAMLADTSGGQEVHLHGANFGPMRNDNVVTASYGVFGSQEVYEAQECKVSSPHKTISCLTVAGVGKPLFWSVLVDGQNSTVPTTSYARPEIHNISLHNPEGGTRLDITKAATTGGQLLVIQGAYFGAIGSNDIKSVSYGKMGRTYLAENCAVVSNIPSTEARMQCITAPGVGRDLRFMINIGGQESAIVSTDRSAATLSYADPEIHSISPAKANTADTITVKISGVNFGPPDSTLLGITFGYRFSDPFEKGSVLRFGDIQCTDFLSFTPTKIVCSLPKGSGTVLVSVNNGWQLSSSQNDAIVEFAYDHPVIESISPLQTQSTAAGELVILTGFNFAPVVEANTLRVGEQKVAIKSVTPNQIVFLVPAGVGGEVAISVTVGQGTSNSVLLRRPGPSVIAVSPRIVLTEGGETVHIAGENFAGRLGSTQGGEVLRVTGANFGYSSNLTLDGVACDDSQWLPFDPLLGNKSSVASSGSENPIGSELIITADKFDKQNKSVNNLNLPVLACKLSSKQIVGFRNVAVDVADTTGLVNDSLIKASKMGKMRSPAEHLHSITGAGSIIVLYLYFALISMAVQVHQCSSVDENLSVLIAEPSEPCKITYSLAAIKKMGFAGSQEFYGVLFPLSIVSLVFYGVGIPIGYHLIFYTNRESIVLDLWRRARGKDVEGMTHRIVPAAMKIQKVWRAYKLRHASGLGGYFVSKNPKKIAYLDVRRLFGKVYEDFSPDHSHWRLVQLWRKMLICLLVIVFANSAVLTAGTVSIILTLAFALQMHVKPFMYSRIVFSTEHQSDHKVRNRNTIAHTQALAKIRAKAQYHCETSLQGKRSINKHLQKIAKRDQIAAQLESLRSEHYGHKISQCSKTVIEFLMDFNSLEAINLLFCSILLNVGVIFEGLRSLETNTHGNSFMDVPFVKMNGEIENIEEDPASSYTDEGWKALFARALEIVSWCMFVAFVFICVSSMVVDVVRNCLYHSYDMMRVRKITRIHKQQQKQALEIYHQNVLDAHEETTELKSEMGKLQDKDAKRLAGLTKDFETKKNTIEKEMAKAALEKMRLVQKLRKLQKKQPKLIAQGGGDLPPLIDVSNLDTDDEIERCLREFDEALKERSDPAAIAARARMERRLKLRKAQIKKQNMESSFAAELADVDRRLDQQMKQDIAAVVAADNKEDKVLEGMTDEDVEQLLEKLMREANEGVPDGNMKKSHERLQRKLERRQKKKMLRERAAQQISQIEIDNGGLNSEISLKAKEEVSRNLEAEIDRLDKQAADDRSRFAKQFRDDHEEQSLRLREKLRRKHQKKLAKFQKKTLEKLESAVQADETAVEILGEGDHSLMLKLQDEIARCDKKAQSGQDELDRLIEENAADSRQLLNEALAGQEKMHNRLNQRLLERKRKRREREQLGEAVAGHVDVTQVGGVRGALQAMRSRNALKSSMSALKEARASTAELKEDLLIRRGHSDVQELRESRWSDEDQKAMENGMAELDAMHQSKMRQLQLEKEAEIENARAAVETSAHLEVELEEIISRHEKSSEQLRQQMETERLHHKNLLAERIKQRSRHRREEHEKKQAAQAAVPVVDIETDLRFAQLELEQAEREADEQMLKFLASQKAFQEELERETELHHAHISERIKKRRKRREALEKKKKGEDAASNGKSAAAGSPAFIMNQMQSLIKKASQSELTDEGVNALAAQLAALAGQQKTGAARGAVKTDL
eukprot:g5000.t1